MDLSTLFFCNGAYSYAHLQEHLNNYRLALSRYHETRYVLAARDIISLREDLELYRSYFCDIEPEVRRLYEDEKLVIDDQQRDAIKAAQLKAADGKKRAAAAKAKAKFTERRQQLHKLQELYRRLENLHDSAIPGITNAMSSRIRSLMSHPDYENANKVATPAPLSGTGQAPPLAYQQPKTGEPPPIPQFYQSQTPLPLNHGSDNPNTSIGTPAGVVPVAPVVLPENFIGAPGESTSVIVEPEIKSLQEEEVTADPEAAPLSISQNRRKKKQKTIY